MAVCVGRGPDGSHCCWTPEGLCQFYADGCSIFGRWGERVWLDSPIGRYFAATFPGFHCGDFPQNIPAVMDNPAVGKCCWTVV